MMLRLMNCKKYIYVIFFTVAFITTSCGVRKANKHLPDISAYDVSKDTLIYVNDTLRIYGESSLRKNEYAQWELVARGENPLDLGNTVGILSEDLVKKQEEIFMEQVETFVPSKFKQYFLRKFLAWYNRKIYLNVKEEYKVEIYGVSQYSSDKFDLLGSKYLKSLYLHGAHDIGHAMQDLALVGCSSFAVWGDQTVDGELIIGRNFDFYAGDEFAQDKMIQFIEPAEGYRFVAISWAGMIGVMSGMNQQGITVTINAGKSDMPLVAKTPISLVAREILQYASTTEEAIKIAKEKQVFVSESIMVGSANDNKAILIEMSPEKFGVYDVPNTSRLICTNHFQSDTYSDDENNLEHIASSHSKFRHDRLEVLLNDTVIVTPKKAVEILRDRKGVDGSLIGNGNEKSLNQLLAHHGVVFKPNEKRIWISSAPYQLGNFVSFQLDSVFDGTDIKNSTLSNKMNLIPKDPFLNTKEYKDYESYRELKVVLTEDLESKKVWSDDKLKYFVSLNPEFWEVYYLVGRYYFERKTYDKALPYFENALSKEVTTTQDIAKLEDYIKKTKRKI